MKWAGILLVIVSLSAGSLAAACAYQVPLSLPDDYFKDKGGNNLTLKTDAGVVVLGKETLAALKQAGQMDVSQVRDELNKSALKRLKPEQLTVVKLDEGTGLALLDGSPIPLVKNKTGKKNTELTPKLLRRLREQSKSSDPRIARQYVIVREFFFFEPPYSLLNLWSYNWLFLLSVVGLIVGAGLLRISAKREITAADQSRSAEEEPQAALHGIQQILLELQNEVKSLSQRQALSAIIDKLDQAQRVHMQAFIDARPQLIGRLGMGGYAALMDSYAACERQINRAWSAAADNVFEEAVECLDNAAEILEETIARLAG